MNGFLLPSCDGEIDAGLDARTDADFE